MKKTYFFPIKPAILLSIAVSFMFFLYAPIELYLNNKEEFWYDLYILVPIMFVVFLIFFCLNVLILTISRLINEKLYTLFLMLEFIAFICSYIQGNYLIDYLPIINGEYINWDLYPQGRVYSAVLWAIVVVITLVMVKLLHMEKMLKIVNGISVCAVIFFISTLIILSVAKNGLEHSENICITEDKQFELSDNQNFVILLLDATDATIFSEVLHENEEKYTDIFEDFTYYDNAMGAYPATIFSVPYILSGKWFEHQMPRKDYFKEVLTGSELFDTLENKEYDIGLYDLDMSIDEDTMGRFNNVKLFTKKVSSYVTFVRWQILLTGMKYAPHDLKRFSFVNPYAFSSLKVAPEGSSMFTGDNLEFYNNTLNNEISIVNRKQFKFIHLNGAHPPYNLDKNMKRIENGDVYQSIEASITMVDAYLKKLKEAEIYDDTIIIVLADHGWKCTRNPIFLVKGIEEKHNFTVSHAPISYSDLQGAYKKLLDGSVGEDIFDWTEGDIRERRFLSYNGDEEDTLTECIQKGVATDELEKTGRVFVEKK